MAKSKAPEAPDLDVLPAKRIKQAVLSVRLDEPTIAWLEEAAQRKGIGASTLARMWILEKLSQEPVKPGDEWV